MKTICIELISKGEKALLAVLDSVVSQDFQDYSIVCVNSSTDSHTSDIIKEAGAELVGVDHSTKALNARSIAHEYANGEFSLVLDSTRVLKKGALSALVSQYSTYDLTCIKESSIGQGFWVNQAGMLRDFSEMQATRALNRTSSFILPRFYRSSLLDKAFGFIKENIPESVFKEISYGEHHLIFECAYKFSKNIGVTDSAMIEHFEDESFAAIFKKYHWYGRSQRTLNQIPFASSVKKISSHTRMVDLGNLGSLIRTLPISFARAIPFFLGYLIA